MCNLTKGVIFLVFRLPVNTNDFMPAVVAVCCRFGQLKGAQESPKAPRVKDWRALRNMQAFALGITKIFLKSSLFCLWKCSSFSKSLGGHWKAPEPSWHTRSLISVTGVDYGTTLHTWTQLVIFLVFSKNNSPCIWRSDGSDVHSAHSRITSQARLNHLCSYETGRQVLLHFTDGNHKARD